MSPSAAVNFMHEFFCAIGCPLFLNNRINLFLQQVFSANFNHSSMVKNDVYPHIMSRILRIMPKEWIGYCALRVEFYGQYEGERLLSLYTVS
jgi:hypothetical protein